ncbi:hypothetical protein FPSE_09363 [Fusarium pseudograminearum CS3096]|uniref:Secreted protein n=1 Tax=Fusarium pseudograminearum (strain CS3096) TaxID=1028729 RepID=K3VA88_FUSPC|nr:hypothetical protein FPSE_09363 [Fusarium pseudograminearum CS3096]EKJ70369.1 hypothetical protein FPSE_09363 [Fusarium pseudograminearum CS3096]
MLKLGLLFSSTLWMIRDVQPQVQDPHDGIVIRDRRSLRLILAKEPIVVDWIFQWTTGLGRVFDDTCRRGVLGTLNLVGLRVFHVIDLIRHSTAMIVCGTIKIVVRLTATCDISGPERRNAISKDGWMHDIWEYFNALNVNGH